MLRIATVVLLLVPALLYEGYRRRKEPTMSRAEHPAAQDVLPDGWRWESYRDAEVAVPGDWAHDNGTQRMHQWCLWRGPSHPAVGRPGVMTLVGCPEGTGQGPHPSTLVERLGTFVAFEDARRPADESVSSEGDRTTVRVGAVDVVVQAEPGLRQRILGTVRRVTVDANGCPVGHPISGDPGRRPSPAVDVSLLTGVRTVSACKYSIQASPGHPRGGPTLMSSLLLHGDAARRAVDAVAHAPAGGGPDAPGQGPPELSFGGEAIVLHMTSDHGASEIYLRYAGHDHNGFDDGIARRTLTRDAVAPFLGGPNMIITGFSGSGDKESILAPRTR